MPDFVHYLTNAETMGGGVAPWELFEPYETQPPRWWWRQANSILQAARAAVRERKELSRK